ncbi:hypothetical protein ES703_30090 [subsurface metagenome]|jgi:hypothetical protein
MQMDTITELLNFPDFKVTHMVKNRNPYGVRIIPD